MSSPRGTMLGHSGNSVSWRIMSGPSTANTIEFPPRLRGPRVRPAPARASSFLPVALHGRRAFGLERASLDRWRNLEFRLEGLQSLRYGHYLRCLMEDAPDADVVMITDLRDVVFQRDPFADPVTGLEVYLEDSSERIGHDGFNTTWLRNLYGSEFVEARRGQPLSCSGVVVGTRTAMMTYLNEMVTGIFWRRRPMGSHDQGVHNGLLHTGRLPPPRSCRTSTAEFSPSDG